MEATEAESTARELRAAIATVKGGRRNTVIPAELRKRALAYWEKGGERGSVVAKVLGIHETTLINWRREAEGPTRGTCGATFVPVQVVASVGEAPVTEIASPVASRERATRARSLRVLVIDGVEVDSLATVLRSLW